MSNFLPNVWLRRLVLVAVSLALGYGITVLAVEFVMETTIAEYMWGPEFPIPLPYFFLTGMSFALFFAVWLDKFLATEILPH